MQIRNLNFSMMLNRLKNAFSLFFVVFVAAQLASAQQMVEQPKWNYTFNKKEIKTGEVVEIILTTQAPSNWYIYSTNVKCDVGPVKADLVLEPHASYEKVGALYSVGDKLETDDVFECQVGKFTKKAELRQKIKILSPNPVIKGYLEGQMCNNASGMCVQLEVPDFTFKGLNVAGESIAPKAVIEETKPTEAAQVESKITVSATSENKASGDYEELIRRFDEHFGYPKEQAEINEEPFVPQNTYKAESSEQVGQCRTKKYSGDIGGVKKNSYFGFFLLAFLSGLGALITPCVFPMIPMTVSFFMKGNNKKPVLNGLLFGGSLIGIYTILGTLVAVTFGADAANFISTHWLPNVLFFIIFIVFAAAFFGAFELVLPASIVNKVDKQADKGGLIGIFFMALTIALVSFSCTGPIVGTVLVESITGEFVKPIIGMFGFSLAFAIPFGLFAMFPKWLNSLPKSGGWLNSVKVSLGFLELALGLKFLSIADQTYHWGLLDRDVYIALWIVIFSLLGIYLMGKIKFSHDSDMPYLKVPRLFLSIGVFSFVAYLIPGLWGAPLKALAGYLPPMQSHDFALLHEVKSLKGKVGNICEEPKYSDKLHLPHNLHGYFDYEQGMACAKRLNKPVFIDFTGHGCVNCREMEARVWSDQRVLDILAKEYVIIALYVDEKTIMLPEEEHYFSKVTGRKVTSLDKKNADIQICMFGTNSQPNYILLDNNEQLLNYPAQYDLNVNTFIDFLKTGVKNYKEQKQTKAKEGV